MAALALAWLLHVPELTAIVVGPNDVAQLAPVRDALDIRLDGDEHARIGGLFA
jgi:aryl-alcohol dehydrogenase-like predicted oxidoreductase